MLFLINNNFSTNSYLQTKQVIQKKKEIQYTLITRFNILSDNIKQLKNIKIKLLYLLMNP